MPRGENLIPGQHKLSVEEQSLGGLRSVQSRAEKKQIREYLQMLLESEIGKDKNGNPVTGSAAMAQKVFKAALDGDWRAWELARDTAGQKPVDKVVIAEVDTETINEVETAVMDAGKEDE